MRTRDFIKRLRYTPERLKTLRYVDAIEKTRESARFTWLDSYERAGLVEYGNPPGWRLTPAGRALLDTWEAMLNPMGETEHT